MNPDRTILKLDARERMRRYQPNPIVIGLIVFLLTWVLQYLSLSVLGLNFEIRLTGQNFTTPEEMISFMEDLRDQFWSHFHPSVFAVILALALTVMDTMVQTGHMIFALHVTREEKADYGNLLDGFAVFFKVIILKLLQSLIVYLFSLLLIVPGVIMAYRYRQAMYLLLDHPERSPIECLKASGNLMRGHKMELLLLDLSFLGWLILQWLIRPFAIWVWPYQALTYANYYRALIGEKIPAENGQKVYEGSFSEMPQDDQDDTFGES